MEEDAPADRVTILLHAADHDLELLPVRGDVECRAHQIGAAQRAAVRRGQHEFRAYGREPLLRRGGDRRGHRQRRRQPNVASQRRGATPKHR